MDVQKETVKSLLGNSQHFFFIPPFQRAYAWGKEEIDRFFDDVRRLVESELNPEELYKKEHFFGTIVVKGESCGVGNNLIVIDGQQRLTTSLLLVIALRDTLADERQAAQLNETFLTSRVSNFDEKIKLKQVSKDWDAYKALVLGESPAEDGAITNAYTRFITLIKNYGEKNENVHLEHYLYALDRLNVARISLENNPYKGEDPQIIFETLNSLGKPLTLADLVRNYILLGMESGKQSDIYDNVWYPKLEAPLGEDVSNFFRDYLQMRLSSQVKVVSNNNTKEIYRIFKDVVSDAFPSMDDFVREIIPYVTYYQWILHPFTDKNISENRQADEAIKELLYNIFFDIKTDPFNPLVLRLLALHQNNNESARLSDEKLIESLESIRLFLIRRRLCKLAGGENQLIPRLCTRVEEIASGKKTMLEILFELPYVLRIPNDDELEKVLSEADVYKDRKDYIRFAFLKMEEHRSKRKLVLSEGKKPTIEHVMPETLNAAWRSYLGADYERIYNTYLHNIGNLILTEFPSEMKNLAFEEKKKKLRVSSLHSRFDLIAINRWDEAAILQHQKDMIRHLSETFPLPEEYRKRDWSRDMDEEGLIFPLDEITEKMVKGTKPRCIRILEEDYPVKQWKEVLPIFFRVFRKDYPDSFSVLLENSEILFNDRKNPKLITYGQLKVTHSNESINEYYRTLESKTIKDIASLADSDILVYVNLSALVTTETLGKAARFLELDREDVFIELK